MKIIDDIKKLLDAHNTLKEAEMDLKASIKRNKRLEAEKCELKELCDKLELRLKVSGKYLDESKTALDDVTKELAELKKLVRKQTEADLLLVSKQIEKRILEGEKVKKDDPMADRQRLLSERDGMVRGQRASVFQGLSGAIAQQRIL